MNTLLGIYGFMALITGIIACVVCYRDEHVFRKRIVKMYKECIVEDGYSTKKALFVVAASIVLGIFAVTAFWPLFWIITIIASL